MINLRSFFASCFCQAGFDPDFRIGGRMADRHPRIPFRERPSAASADIYNWGLLFDGAEVLLRSLCRLAEAKRRCGSAARIIHKEWEG